MPGELFFGPFRSHEIPFDGKTVILPADSLPGIESHFQQVNPVGGSLQFGLGVGDSRGGCEKQRFTREQGMAGNEGYRARPVA